MKRDRAITQANSDFAKALTSAVWFQMLAALFGAAAAATVAVGQGSPHEKWELAGWAAAGAIGGYVSAGVIVYIMFVVLAPYRQRNAARDQVDAGLLEITRLNDLRPRLELGAPYSLDKEWVQLHEMTTDPRFDTVELMMFRIPITNVGHYCDKITVRVVSVEPPLPDAPD